MTPDPMQLLRASNPVRDCDAPDFDRLLARLEREPSEPQGDQAPGPGLGRFSVLRTKKVPSVAAGGTRRPATGRRVLAGLVPVAVALAVAAVAIVSLHGGRAGRSGPVRTTPATASLAGNPGQARGHVVPGSMHPFTVEASGAHNSTWGAEWFRTTAGQICVQAGRQVGRQLGYVAIDGLRPADGRFHPWPSDTAVDARCIDQPAHGGVALMVAEVVDNSGAPLRVSGACTAAGNVRCPPAHSTTLYFGVLGASAGIAGYGTLRHSTQMNIGPGPDGEYIESLPLAVNGCAVAGKGCPPGFPLPRRGAFIAYSGSDRVCSLRGPGTDGLLAGDCPYGLTIGPTPLRLRASQVRTSIHVRWRRVGGTISVAARFRTRVASSRLAEYALRLSTPGRCPPNAGSTSSSLPLGPGFRAGALLTIHGTARATCAGTYHGAVIAQPLVGHQLTVGRFSFKAPPRR